MVYIHIYLLRWFWGSESLYGPVPNAFPKEMTSQLPIQAPEFTNKRVKLQLMASHTKDVDD